MLLAITGASNHQQQPTVKSIGVSKGLASSHTNNENENTVLHLRKNKVSKANKKQHTKNERNQQDRKLEVYSVPFTLFWRIEIDGKEYQGELREPTAEEYDGLAEAVVNWLNTKSDAHYYEGEEAEYDDSDFSFVDNTCEVVPEETAFDPNAKDGYPYRIMMNCNANFEAEELNYIPSSMDYIMNINEYYDFGGFTQAYLWNAAPEESIFQYTQSIHYHLSTDGSMGDASGSFATGNASSSTTPVATAPSLSVIPGDFTESYVVPFSMEWHMAVGDQDRQPTPEEYDGMLKATMDWFTYELTEFYADQADVFVMSEFGASIDPSPIYNASGAATGGEYGDYPHKIPMECFVIFKSDDMSNVPSVADVLQVTSQNFDMTLYLTTYLRNAEPSDNISDLSTMSNIPPEVTCQCGLPCRTKHPT